MSTSEKIRNKALPLAVLCGIVSVLLFVSAMGTGARIARMSRMHRTDHGSYGRTYQSPGGPADRGGRKARPVDGRHQKPGQRAADQGRADQGGRRAQVPGRGVPAAPTPPVPGSPAAPAQP